MGEKVEMEDDTEQKHFAFLAQIFMTHKAYPSGSPHLGDSTWSEVALDNLLEYFANLDLASKAMVARTVEKVEFNKVLGDLTKPIATMRLYKEELVDPFADLSKRYKNCILERYTMYTYTERLLYLVWASVYLAVLGRNTTVEEDIDDGSFTALNGMQIADLFKRLPSKNTGQRGLTEKEASDEMAEIHQFLKFHLRNSRQVFDHYSAAAHSGEKGTMDRSEYWRLVKDVGMQKLMSTADIDLLFQKANIDYSREGTDRVADVDAELQPIEFIEVLCRLAMEKYKTKALTIRLEQLYLKDLLPNAQAANKNAFREMMKNVRLKNVLKRNKRRLRTLFKIYAAGTDSNSAFSSEVNQVSTISPSELVKMGRDLRLIGVGKTLSDTVIRRIFAHVQQDEDEDGNGDEDDSEMVFEEFQEVIVVFCCFTDADPYFPIEKRCERFLKSLFAEADKFGHRI